MSDEQLGPIEPRQMRFPVPPVGTHYWEQKDWDVWIAKYGVPEPLTISRPWGEYKAIGRNDKGELVYRLNTEGEV